MRASIAMVALFALTATAARAGDDPAPRVDPELLEQIREAHQQRGKVSDLAPASGGSASLESRLAKGDAQRAAGDHPRALWSYLLAHRLDPEDPRPIGRIGTLHLSREPERAEAIFRELVRRDGGSGLARTGLGLALIARGAWNEAVVELREAVEEDGALAATHNALGVALDHLKQAEAARWHYGRASQLQPRSHEPWNNLGVSLLGSDDFAGAAQAFEQAGRLEPRDAAVWNNLGVARGRLGQYDAALAAFRKAGGERAAQNNLGYVHYLNDDYDGALAAYERALHAAGEPGDRLPVLRNARAAQQAKSRPRARAAPPAPEAGADAPGLGPESRLRVEETPAPEASIGAPAAAEHQAR
jgi:Flp pilus assembly protein TadD